MTPDQIVEQLRQELATNQRISDLLRAHAENFANMHFRKAASTMEHESMLRYTGIGIGAEAIVKDILKDPRPLKGPDSQGVS